MMAKDGAGRISERWCLKDSPLQVWKGSFPVESLEPGRPTSDSGSTPAPGTWEMKMNKINKSPASWRLHSSKEDKE